MTSSIEVQLVRGFLLVLTLCVFGCGGKSEGQMACDEAFSHQETCGVALPQYEDACPEDPSPGSLCVYECNDKAERCDDFFDSSSPYFACVMDCLSVSGDETE